jgi:polysaccharide biosynthesis transport protein
LNPEPLAVPHNTNDYARLLTDMPPILWRRRRAIYVALVLTSAAAFLFYDTVGERYQSYTLLRVGQGIRDRPTDALLGEAPDLTSRIESLGRIATTDHVIRSAASAVGFSRLFKKDESGLTSAVREWVALRFLQALPKQLDFLKPRTEVNETKDDVNETKDNQQQLVASLRGLISAKQEGRSDLLRVSFRHPDPAIAAKFLNELADALITTQGDLVQVPGADIFFQQQTKRLEQAAEQAGTNLRNFSVAASIYSVADQRKLLLQRADTLGSLIASTRGSIEERKGQKQVILDELVTLRPVHQSRTVTAIVNSLRGRDYKEIENPVGTIQNEEELPPLLLVKVYQDAMANLLKVNTDLNGSLRVENLLTVELEKINAELASLSSKEAEYEQLKRVLTSASAAAEHYASRVIEEQINQDIAKKNQLSSVRVVQRAEKPIEPVFPRAADLVLLALVGGIALGSAFAVMVEFTRVRRQEEGEEGVGHAIEEVIRRSVRSHLKEIQAAE